MASSTPNPRTLPCVAQRRREMSQKALVNPSERPFFTKQNKRHSLHFLQEAYFCLQNIDKPQTADRVPGPVSRNISA